MKLHHFGIACADISETLTLITGLFPVTGHSAIIHDPGQNADLCMVSVAGSPPLELISGPMVEHLVKKSVLLYHTCWEIDDMQAAIALFSKTECRLISEPREAVLFNKQRVAFMMTPIGLVELLEAPR
jgi:methylmalonyl-CoA/ethylmalonyl-CoA epimerase